MLVTYGRSTGGRAGPDDLTVADDGAFTLWRLASAGPVGRFAGRLGAADLDALRADVAAARAAGPLDAGVRMPGGRTEEITLGSLSVVLPDEDPGGPWSALAGRLRGLLDALTAFPVAAVVLEADDGAAALVHTGTETLRLRLSSLEVHAILFGPSYTRMGEWRAGAAGDEDVEAGPGWRLDLPFDHGLDVGDGRSLQVVVSFEAFDGPAVYPVQVVRPPQL